MAATLKEQVMRKLRVTWEDEATSARIDDIIASAEADLRRRIGIPDSAVHDFSKPGAENILLLAYCYYMWNDAEDEFKANYEEEIAQTRRKWMVSQYAEEQESSDDA